VECGGALRFGCSGWDALCQVSSDFAMVKSRWHRDELITLPSASKVACLLPVCITMLMIPLIERLQVSSDRWYRLTLTQLPHKSHGRQVGGLLQRSRGPK
jgi:hypothetical protein